MTLRSSLTWLAVCVAAFVLAYLLGDGYIDRLPNHAGYFLVPVDDRVAAAHVRPRHTVVIVVDGLSRNVAEKFESKRLLAEAGQCRIMSVGPITISRPVYAVISTGLEQDRSGCRNNDETRPLAVDSIWQQARRSGLEVTAVSSVPWWQQLFPDGFDRYDIVPTEGDPFARAEIGDLTLIHPLYVDDMGHKHGALSVEYVDAAERADRGVASILHRLDLTQDLVVLTADHGHMSYGGHGGPQQEIAEVMTCFAGRGVAHRADVGRMESRSLAPALALLLGVPFPSHMRAGEDNLDVIFDIADPNVLSDEYLADRHAAIERFREKNRAELARWLGPGVSPSWSNLYAREEKKQRVLFGVGLLFMGLVLIGAARQSPHGAGWLADFLVWVGLTLAATLALYAWLRGSLDFTSINAKTEFLRAGLGVSACVGILSVLGHGFVFSDRNRLLRDQILLVCLMCIALVLHPIVYGWPLGFPLPGAGLLFFPFFAPLLLIVHSLLGAILCLAFRRDLAR